MFTLLNTAQISFICIQLGMSCHSELGWAEENLWFHSLLQKDSEELNYKVLHTPFSWT